MIGSRPIALIYLPVLHAPREMGSVIDELLARNWSISILVGTSGIDSALAPWAARGAELIYPPQSMTYGQTISTKTASVHRNTSTLSFLRQAYGKLPSSLKRVVSTWRQFRSIRDQEIYALNVIDQRRPDVYISSNFHSCGRLDGALLKAAKSARIPSVCLLVSPLVGKIIGRPGRLVQYYSGMVPRTYRTDNDIFSRLMAFLRHHWTVADKDTRIFMWPPELMLAAYLRKVLPADIWQEPSEDFDLVVAYNKFSRDLLERGGFPMEKVIAFNPVRLDESIRIASNRSERAQILNALGLASDTPYIIWNMEPAWEHNYCEESLHWSRIRQMAGHFALIEKPVVISLHPLCNPNNYRFLEYEFGLRLADAGIHLLYPYCAFVVSFGCSTNQFALTFKKSILMYDWFGIREDERRWGLYGQPEMEVAETMEEFNTLLTEWVDRCDWTSCFTWQQLPPPSTPLVADEIAKMVR